MPESVVAAAPAQRPRTAPVLRHRDAADPERRISQRGASQRRASQRRTSQRGAAPGGLSWAPALCTYRTALDKEHPVEIFFETLLVLVCVGVLAFAYLTVKKLYQGQR
ncbi:hypothetical protein [Streptomyces sp. NPDC046985]|uniref:hypothetical protein n=1 Tax=Streptomyces sp. NPDC046985 TaxID=3155377 RepID=UPI0033C790DE